MSEKMITVATFNFATDANFLIFKMKLQEEGILYNAAEENTVGIDPFLSITVGGIRVLVNEADALRARAILQEIEQTEITPENIEIEFGDNDTILDEVNYRIVPLQADAASQAYFYVVVGLMILLTLAIFVTLLVAI